MRIIQMDEIIKISKERADREVALSKNIYNILNGPRWLPKITEFVATATYQLLYHGFDEAKLNDAMAEEPGLEVWGKGVGKDYIEKTRYLCEHRKLLNAGDCSDLIRLFGSLVEDKKHLLSNSQLGYVDRKRLEKRVGGEEAHWGASRARGKAGEKASEPRHVIAGRNKMLEQRRLKAFSGITLTRLKRESTVRKIDVAFGLPAGCDISGTTADSIFFVELMRDFIAGDVLASMNITDKDIKTIQLLPLATMVSQAHHTVLECALTLTLNRYMKYHAGYYDTLIPIGGCDSEIENILKDAGRRAAESRLNILCYLSPKLKFEAYQMMTYDEIELFKKIAQMTHDTLLTWKASRSPLLQEEAMAITGKAYLYHVIKQ